MALKQYKASFADVVSKRVQHDHPERTAYRIMPGIAGDYVFQVWPNRETMLTTIRMQEKGPANYRHWRALVRE